MNRLRPTKGRRPAGNPRRLRFDERGPDELGRDFSPRPEVDTRNLPAVRRGAVGWDHSLSPEAPATYRGSNDVESPLAARILALFSDPRIDFLTVSSAADALGHPRQDIETTLEAMRQAGIIAAGALYALDHHVERLPRGTL